MSGLPRFMETFTQIGIWDNAANAVRDFRASDFINVYHVTREYGGPEEGGWYYDQWEPVADKCNVSYERATLDSAIAWCEDQNQGEPPLSSVGSHGLYRVQVEENHARREPEYRPHYE